ncbi:ABC transporter permease [Paenactinomyces guangxiensis]|uniref:ABC transporter permease n=1 Tax=Paenactinomyces guangxiensis TaxID=1490290 RepID=A0A7W2A6W0_9BACL|nr:ABC transporter permease [Paenactinomyces guangxiensis]MBA4493846.1 ABC transporter permease [Paenactinomyces guangxiensis]MBH8591312.1 ABC transporter permease [Paenactinomyces guangxiensis]
MMLRILTADWIKIRRTWVIWLTLLGPVCTVLVQVLNYGVRMDYLLPQGWNGLMFWVQALLFFTLMLGSAILAAMSSAHEHDARAWKQTFALPVSRFQFFAGKFIWLVICLAVAVTLTIAGVGLFGMIIGLPDPVPWKQLTQLILYPYLALFPFLALQLWLSMIIKNQALPVAIGIAGTVFAPFSSSQAHQHLHWLIWSYPYNASPLSEVYQEPEQWVWMGAAVGLLFLIAGAIHFSRKEVQ